MSVTGNPGFLSGCMKGEFIPPGVGGSGAQILCRSPVAVIAKCTHPYVTSPDHPVCWEAKNKCLPSDETDGCESQLAELMRLPQFSGNLHTRHTGRHSKYHNC